MDPEGDAKYWASGSTSDESDANSDVLALDVTANRTTVTTELRIADLTWDTASTENPESSWREYSVTLKRANGYFSFRLQARLADGTFAATGTFWKPYAAAGDAAGAYEAFPVEGVKGSLDVKKGLVRMTATMEAMNGALGRAFTSYEPIAFGSTVVPVGGTPADAVKSPDPDFAYRLGD